MRKLRSIVEVGGVLVGLGSSAAPLYAQCALCRNALTNSPEGRMLIQGFNHGIVLLLAVPLAIFGSVVFLLWRAGRRRRGESAIVSERQSQFATPGVSDAPPTITPPA